MTAPDKLALASRAEQAGGPDRELDCHIHVLRNGGTGRFKDHHDWTAQAICENWNVPRYTASLDAIMALIAEKLPAAHWKVFTDEGRFDAAVNLWEPDNYCANPALALCAAFLRALASTEDQP